MIAAWPAYDVAGHHAGNDGSGAGANVSQAPAAATSACKHCRQVRKKLGSVSSPLLSCVLLSMRLPTWQ